MGKFAEATHKMKNDDDYKSRTRPRPVRRSRRQAKLGETILEQFSGGCTLFK